MTVIRCSDGNGNEIAALSIFAVHCTSYHNTNQLVSSDNKGYASLLMEADINGNATLPGHGRFVAAFPQTNEGDVSPNTQGAWCNGTVGGVYCGNNRSLCDGRNEQCVSVGPTNFKDDMGSVRLIGERQYAKAKELFTQAGTTGLKVTGTIGVRHSWVDMSKVLVSSAFTSTKVNETTCRPAVGFSFAAGTTDGPGAFNFYQGDNCSKCTLLWDLVRDFSTPPLTLFVSLIRVFVTEG